MVIQQIGWKHALESGQGAKNPNLAEPRAGEKLLIQAFKDNTYRPRRQSSPPSVLLTGLGTCRVGGMGYCRDVYIAVARTM